MQFAHHLSQLLRQVIENQTKSLQSFPEEKIYQAIAPGKWSPIEIMGHLVDSASNNHQRFVRAQFQDTLIFNGYQQDGWVVKQAYQKASWKTIISLWTSFNLHLAHYIAQIPEEILLRPITAHNFHQIAFKTVQVNEASTLAYFIYDYIGHIEHHLRHFLPGFQATLPPYANDFHKRKPEA